MERNSQKNSARKSQNVKAKQDPKPEEVQILSQAQ